MGQSQNKQVIQQKVKEQRELDNRILWGDFNNNEDNLNIINNLVNRFKFKRENIYQCFSEEVFKSMAEQFNNMSNIILMSGGFAKKNNYEMLKWITSKIEGNELHCRGVIIFTSEYTINNEKWNLQNLKNIYPNIIALEYETLMLYKSLDKVIYNQSHIPFDLVSNLNLYFSNRDFRYSKLFSQSLTFDIFKYRKYLNQSNPKIQKLIQLIGQIDEESPLINFKNGQIIYNFIEKLTECFNRDIINNKNYLLNESEVINNLIHLFSQESYIYKIINCTLCTLNPQIYDQLKPIYKIFSTALAKYKDNNTKSEMKLFRGSLISKEQYSKLSMQFSLDQSNQKHTFIYFPSFTSTSLKKEIAQHTIDPSMQQKLEMLKYRPYLICKKNLQSQNKNTTIKSGEIGNISLKEQVVMYRPYLITTQKQTINTKDISNNNQTCLINHDEEDYPEFKIKIDNFNKVIFHIRAKINLQNDYRPKYIAEISKYNEEEFLFQPFSYFRIYDIIEPSHNNKYYEIYLEYLQ